MEPEPAEESTLVSVVLPVHEGAAHLARAIDSVLEQSYRSLELIVVLDRCTDDSPRIASRAATSDPRVRVVEARGAGFAAALNTGIDSARGPWIARMDADDVCLPRRIELQVAAAHQQPQIVAWTAWARAVRDDGRFVSMLKSGPTTLAEFDEQHSTGRLRPIDVTAMIRRDGLLAAGGYDTGLQRAQDTELFDRLGEHGPVLTLPVVLAEVRAHRDSHTSTDLSETLRVHRFVQARRRAAHDGQTLTYDAFVRAERTQSRWRRVRLRMHTYARVRYRAAGIHYAEGKRLGAVSNLVLASAVAPVVVAPRFWSQFVQPRLVRPGRTSQHPDAELRGAGND